MKKVISFILALVLIVSISIACIPTVSSSAATVSNQAILDGLDKLRDKFPDGKYWNHYGSSKVNLDSWTNTPCPTGHLLNGVRQCNGQCDGFAKKLGLDLFGVAASKWEKKTTLDGLCVGDIIRYGSRHTIMVVGFTDDTDTIIVADCNWDYHCGISWDRYFSISRYIKTVNTVYHYSGNNFTRNAYLALSKPSVTINPNTYILPVGHYIKLDSDLKATVKDPMKLYGSYVNWELSNDTVAHFEYDWELEEYYLVGDAPGTVTLTASLWADYSYKATCTVNVVNTDKGLYRIAGGGRVDTAVEIAKAGWEGADNVVLASGNSFADALAGVPLAAALEAPILLTRNPAAGLEQTVLDEITALGASNIYILGGEAPISSAIETQLKNLNYNVQRIFGQSRFETSVAVAQKLFEITGSVSEVFVASGENYPDALSISPVAGMMGVPIIYSNSKGSIAQSALQFLTAHSVGKATIIGGEGSIPDSAQTTLQNNGIGSVKRLYGTSRFDTCAKILDSYKTSFDKGSILLATGYAYPDALAGGVLAALNRVPIILCGNGEVSADILQLVKYFETQDIFALGGEGAVQNSVVYRYIVD